MNCQKCGSSIIKGELFCPKCGANQAQGFGFTEEQKKKKVVDKPVSVLEPPSLSLNKFSQVVEKPKSLKLGHPSDNQSYENSASNITVPVAQKSGYKLWQLVVLITTGICILSLGTYLIYDFFITGNTSNKSLEKDNTNKDSKNKENNNNDDFDHNDSVDIPDGYQREGSTNYGFLNIPNEWIKEEESSSSAKYVANDNYTALIISTKSLPDGETNVNAYCEKLMTDFHNTATKLMTEEGRSNMVVNNGKITVGNYKIYQFSQTENEDSVYIWAFENSKGNLHMITLQYHNSKEDLSQIINSFKEEK